MDNFITTIMVLYDNINKEKQEGPKLINNKVTEKQFLAYYIYRIWIKYRKLMEDGNTPTEFHKVLLYMEIPKKYHEFYLTYPMANKMTMNEKQLDLIILSILKQFNMVYKIFGPRSDGSVPPENKAFKSLTKYLTGKSIENIVQDVIQIKLMVPNLARPANVRNMWDGIDQMIDDIDVVNPVEFPNPATEIPDTKLIQQNSNISSISYESQSNRPENRNNNELDDNGGNNNSNIKSNATESLLPKVNNKPQEVNPAQPTPNINPQPGQAGEPKPAININMTLPTTKNINRETQNKRNTISNIDKESSISNTDKQKRNSNSNRSLRKNTTNISSI